ncbi:MAG: sigma-70 family RNA polymerase sigma factor [Roseiflexaceae bacterium]
MEHNTADQERCAAMVAALNAELGWHLEADQQRAYVAALLPYLPISPAEIEWRRVVIAYHQDHGLIEALRDQASPQYEAAWTQWCVQAIQILRYQGLGAPDDALADTQDLAQTALEELVRALPSYRYASRFSTWAYTVISRSAQRYLRDRKAAKRSGKHESLEWQHELELALGAADSPEAQSEAHALSGLIDALLTNHSDWRLAEMFRLWVIEDQRLADIARRMRLSPARVSVMMEQVCQLLRRDPAILAWIGDTALRGLERARGEDPAHTQGRPDRYL